jgi:hypothetical protein
MSRGPGTWQRVLLAALERQPAVHLHELLHEGATRSQRVALQRAVRVLAQKGRIGVFDVWDVAKQKRVYVLHRPGYDQHEHGRRHGLEWGGYWIRPREAQR